MTEYINVKLPSERMITLKETLKKNGIKVRSHAEAINTLINNYILENNKS